jgi:hypothetical protein
LNRASPAGRRWHYSRHQRGGIDVSASALQRGDGFQAGKSVALKWTTLTGNGMTGLGWEESARVIAEAVPDAAGHVAFQFKAPDDSAARMGLRPMPAAFEVTPDQPAAGTE